MRQLGSIPIESDAQRFAAFLVAEGIDAHAEQDQGTFAIWVRDENHLVTAKDELARFREDPGNARYQDAERLAAKRRKEEEQQRARARGNVVEMRGRWGKGTATARRAPLTITLIVLSVIVGIASGSLFEPGEKNWRDPVLNQLLISRLAPDNSAAEQDLRDTWKYLRGGQLWRAITPIFIHFGLMHLVFNMFVLYSYGAQIEDRRGTWRLALLVLVIAVASNVGQFLWGGPYFGGMSGVCYGLFGFVWMRMLFSPQSGLYASPLNVFIMVAWFFLCIAQDLPQFQASFGDGIVSKQGVANVAHGVGLVLGMAAGYAPALLRSRR